MPLHPARTVGLTALTFLIAALCAPASAQAPIVDDVRTIATTATGVPVEHDFQIAAAGTYTITLTDVGAQAAAPASPVPLASLKLALTANDALVGSAVVEGSSGSGSGSTSGGTSGVGTLAFTAPSTASYPVTYRVHVIGAPASGNGPGPIATAVTTSSGSAACGTCTWNDLIGLPVQALPSTEALLQDSFLIANAGSYQLTLTDLALPQALGTLSMIVIEPGTTNYYILPDPSTHATQETVTLPAGTWQIYAVAQVASGAGGGLFSAAVGPAGGSAVYAKAVPVGTTVSLGAPELAAGGYTLGFGDLAYPAALTQLGGVLVTAGQAVPLTPSAGGQVVTQLGAGQSGSFTVAGSGTYQLFAAATPTTSAPGAGSYSAQIVPTGGAPVFSVAQAVAAPGGTASAYSFVTAIATAGNYTAALTDFQIPGSLAVAGLAVVQNGAIVGTPLTAPGSSTVALNAGTATLLAVARGGTGGSLMDINLAGAGGATVFDQPQGVGAAFTSRQIAISATGVYQFALSDLQWPAPFSTFTGVVTQGGTLVGQIYGGGTLNAIQAVQGNYYVNIIATPATGAQAPDQAGTYVLNAGAAPPAPTVNLRADAASVAAGGTVHLIWTTTGATSCTASGGGWTGTFSGSQAVSGTATSPAISSSTTFKLSCTGAGGAGSGTVTVDINSSGSGGGGGLDPLELLGLAGFLLLRRRALHPAGALRRRI